MKRLDSATYERRPRNYPIDPYVGKLSQPHREIAVIESTAYPSDDKDTRNKQLEEMKEKARGLGADAIDDLRVLTKKIKGYTLDERTPFISWKQGNYELFFLRGTAVVYESSLPGVVASATGWTTETMTMKVTPTPTPIKPLQPARVQKIKKQAK